MKKMLTMMCVATILFGCTYNDKNITNMYQGDEKSKDSPTYEVSTYMNEEMKDVEKQGSGGMASIIEKPLDEMAAEADAIVLATIVSLDKAVTILPDGSKFQMGLTFGKMLVQSTYKGETMDAKVINFSKQGGVITVAQFDEGSPVEAVEKRQRLRKESGNDIDLSMTYMNMTLDRDITLEEGKTYLLAIKYVEELDCYNIIGMDIMSREVQLPQVQEVRSIDVSDVKVKNNETGSFESIDNVLAEMKIQK